MRASIRLVLAATFAVAIPALCVGADAAMPKRKPGWWQVNVTVEGQSPAPVHRTTHVCADAAPFGIRIPKICPPMRASRTADGWAFEATCTVGWMKVSMHGGATGDFDKHYQVDLTSRSAAAPGSGSGEVRTAIDATWLGPCPAGKKPGDMETSLQTNVAPNAH